MRTYKTGELVRYTSEFLRYTGWFLDVPINGVIVDDSDPQVALVVFSDSTDRVDRVLWSNLEADPKNAGNRFPDLVREFAVLFETERRF